MLHVDHTNDELRPFQEFVLILCWMDRHTNTAAVGSEFMSWAAEMRFGGHNSNKVDSRATTSQSSHQQQNRP